MSRLLRREMMMLIHPTLTEIERSQIPVMKNKLKRRENQMKKMDPLMQKIMKKVMS